MLPFPGPPFNTGCQAGQKCRSGPRVLCTMRTGAEENSTSRSPVNWTSTSVSVPMNSTIGWAAREAAMWITEVQSQTSSKWAVLWQRDDL